MTFILNNNNNNNNNNSVRQCGLPVLTRVLSDCISGRRSGRK